MTPANMERYYRHETKMQTWRIITPIVSVVSPCIVAIFAFFLVRLVSQFDERNAEMLKQIRELTKNQSDFKDDMILKYSQVRYQCCSELGQKPMQTN